MTELEQKLTLAVAGLESGEVVSFGDIAARAGYPKNARAAGKLLSQAMHQLPWWRVVYSSGKLPPCDQRRQTDLLEAEGVSVEAGRVVSSPLGRFKD